jgi:hypothetical protein
MIIYQYTIWLGQDMRPYTIAVRTGLARIDAVALAGRGK